MKGDTLPGVTADHTPEFCSWPAACPTPTDCERGCIVPASSDLRAQQDDIQTVVIDMWEINQREMERRVREGLPLPELPDGTQITPEQVAAWRAERGPGEISESSGGAVAVQGPTGVGMLVPVPFDAVELTEIAEEVGMAERCVAACGVPADGNPDARQSTRCRVHPDGAHRCYRSPDHLADHSQPDRTGGTLGVADHQCDCDYVWISLTGGMKEIDKIMNMGAGDALRRLVHAYAPYANELGPSGTPDLFNQIIQRVARQIGVTL